MFMVFDVESVGLHGEGFAVGWVVVDRDGKHYESGCVCCPSHLAKGTAENRAWVAANIPPMNSTHLSLTAMRTEFWEAWVKWGKQGAVLVADCSWPVEARFLAACVDDAPAAREWLGPYPLHDLASVLLACGKDPLQTTERLPTELPEHHPLADARQSARQLVAALADYRR